MLGQINCKFQYDIKSPPDSITQSCFIFLSGNSCKFTYPQAALDQNIQREVMLEFMIDINCTISDIKVVKSLGYGLDEIAVKMIQEFEKQLKSDHQTWPTLCNKIKIPIKFSLL